MKEKKEWGNYGLKALILADPVNQILQCQKYIKKKEKKKIKLTSSFKSKKERISPQRSNHDSVKKKGYHERLESKKKRTSFSRILRTILLN